MDAWEERIMLKVGDRISADSQKVYDVWRCNSKDGVDYLASQNPYPKKIEGCVTSIGQCQKVGKDKPEALYYADFGNVYPYWVGRSWFSESEIEEFGVIAAAS